MNSFIYQGSADRHGLKSLPRKGNLCGTLSRVALTPLTLFYKETKDQDNLNDP